MRPFTNVLAGCGLEAMRPKRRLLMTNVRCVCIFMCAVLADVQLHAQAPATPPLPDAVQAVPEQPARLQTILPEGTPLRVRINRTVSSADAHPGDNVDFETLDEIKVGDFIVVPRGSTAMATVTAAQAKRRMARGGKLDMTVDYVRLPSGEKLPLRGIQNSKGGGHTGAMAAGMVATAIVFWPAAPLFLLVHGKDITIPKGHEVTVYTNTDYSISKASAAAAPPAAPSGVSGAPLTNEDVVILKAAGLGDSLVIDKIKASPAGYHLDPSDLIQLKQNGLSDALIGAMLQAKR
ncbi:MAG: PEGA domain-containing protein [Bryobacteraceae bacterium]|jgi:hypothetical protein